MHHVDIAQCYRAAADRGADYILSHQDETGRLGTESILDYYKAPWALAVAGHQGAAWQLLEWIKWHAQTEPGQFHGGDDTPQLLRSSTYRNTFIMMGALLLGRFDILSNAAVANFKGYQHPEIGAFYGEQHFHSDVDLNTNHTGMSGLFCLYAGLVREAECAGRYIVQHFRDQPASDTAFVINTDTAGKLITEYPQGDRFWRVVDYGRPQGHFWAIGTGAAFLAHLFARTGNEEYIDTAKKLLRLSYRLAPGFESWASSGKLAWGAARVYAFTGEEEFASLAQRIGQLCFLETQHTNGSWGPLYLQMGENLAGYELPVLELTAEFTLLTSELAKCLSC